MSRAFVKEDVEIPERALRRRAPSGLPPGALNYMTERGAASLRQEIARLRSTGESAAAGEAQRTLDSATVVAPPVPRPDVVTFGAVVKVKTEAGREETYRIVGVDEVGLEPGAVSWISPEGRALLGAGCGEAVVVAEAQSKVTIVQIEHPSS